MIKRLKIKFILTNMVLITIVLIIAFTTIYIIYNNSLINSNSDAMHNIARGNYSRFDYLFNDDYGTDYSYLNTFIIDVNEYNKTFTIDGFLDSGSILTDEQSQYLNKLINIIEATTEDEGVLKSYNLRYYYIKTPVGKKIVFLDMSYEQESLRNLIITSLIIGVCAEAAFFVISLIVAKIAVKPVEKSIKQQQQLVSDVSHELKTPITVINTNADIILSEPDSRVSDQIKWLGYIKDEASRMSDLVSNMLFLAKADENGIKAELAEIDLSAAAYEAALPFESVCFENGKTLNIDIAPNIFIRADEKSIKQLICILLDNANKYSNESGIITVRAISESDKAMISVFNTGEPIPKESIPHLFERFYRVDKSRSREQGGSGLGLSIAKHIIEMNDGMISVSSSIEYGTTFTCTFKAIKKKPDLATE